MAKGRKTGGRKKGALNTMKGAHQHFRDAWDRCAGPKTAEKLLKTALEKAFGYEVSEKTFKIVRGKRQLAKEVVKREFHFEPITALLPYVAKKMAVEVEATGKDGEPLIPLGPPIDLSKIDLVAKLKLLAALEKTEAKS